MSKKQRHESSRVWTTNTPSHSMILMSRALRQMSITHKGTLRSIHHAENHLSVSHLNGQKIHEPSYDVEKNTPRQALLFPDLRSTIHAEFDHLL